MAAKRKISGSRWGMYSQALVSGAVIAVFLSALGWLGQDIWLASTQWLLVAAVLAALGVWTKLESK